MDKAEYFELVARLTTGKATAEETARAFYGTPTADDVRRLGIHEYYTHWYRGSVLETHYPECKAVLPNWVTLVREYFEAEPPVLLPMPDNVARFPTFLEGRVDAWIVELARLEWMEWQVTIAEVEESGRVTKTLRELHVEHDLVAWLDADDRAATPEKLPTIIHVWRDEAGVAQRGVFGAIDRALFANANPIKFDRTELATAIADLTALGVLR